MYEIGDLVRVRTLDAIPPDDNYIQDSPLARSYFGMSEDQLNELHEAGFLRIKYVDEAINAYGGTFRDDTTPMEYTLEIPEELGYWFDPVFLENMLEPEYEPVHEDLPDPDPESLSEFLAWEGTV